MNSSSIIISNIVFTGNCTIPEQLTNQRKHLKIYPKGMGQNLLGGNPNSYEDFGVLRGCMYLSCVAGPYTMLASPCLYYRVKTQEVFFDGSRIHLKYDCCLCKEDKLIPLDRIQDVNISANCCSRLCGVSILDVQTANGGPQAEAIIIGARDPVALRTMIMDRRDNIVHSVVGSSGVDSMGAKLPVALFNSSQSFAGDKANIELIAIKETLSRIEKFVEAGLERMPLITK